MCNYINKINLIINNYNNYLQYLIKKNYLIYYNELNNLSNCNKTECGCYNIYKLLKYLYYLLKRTYKIYICCDSNICTICKESKYKLLYIKKNNKLINFVKQSSLHYYSKLHEYYKSLDDVSTHLQDKKIPLDIVNTYIVNNNMFICEDKNLLYLELKSTGKYNFTNNLISKSGLFKKYFKLEKICEYSANCKNCILMKNVIHTTLDIIQFHKIKYKTCYDTMDLQPIKDFGFTYFGYNTTKYITIDDYEIMPYLAFDSDTDENYSIVDPPYIDFWD